MCVHLCGMLLSVCVCVCGCVWVCLQMLRPPWGGREATSHCKCVPKALRHVPLTAHTPCAVVWDLFCETVGIPNDNAIMHDGIKFPLYTETGTGKGKSKAITQVAHGIHQGKGMGKAIEDVDRSTLPYPHTPAELAILALESEITARSMVLDITSVVWTNHVARMFNGDHRLANLAHVQSIRDERLDAARDLHFMQGVHFRMYRHRRGEPPHPVIAPDTEPGPWSSDWRP